MKLYEAGKFQLADPAYIFIPSLAEMKVYQEGSGDNIQTVDLKRPITMHDLLIYTAGFTAGFFKGPVCELYRKAEVSKKKTLKEMVDCITNLPLTHQPGEQWTYGHANDVIARIVEIICGMPYEKYLQENVLLPLGLHDTGYGISEDKQDRLATLYGSGYLYNDPSLNVIDLFKDGMQGINKRLAGSEEYLPGAGGEVIHGNTGLLSTVCDINQYMQMVLNNGEHKGVSILSRKTIELMSQNHLAPSALPMKLGSLTSKGYGFGIGFGVVTNVAQYGYLSSERAIGWGGGCNNIVLIDPKEKLAAVLLSQFIPNRLYPVVEIFKNAAYQAIID